MPNGPSTAGKKPTEIEIAETDLISAPGTASVVGPDELDELLERCLEAFLEQAPLPSPADLRALLPERDQATRRFLLTELIKMDMASAAEETPDAFPRIEDYLVHFPELITAADLPIDLVMEEIQLRKECGQTPELSEYSERFPQHRSVIEELLGGGAQAPEATAAVANRSKPPELGIGEQVDDFVIIQTLGSGAFANVYLARQVSMSRLVALKVSRGTGDEPQALAQFDHLNIVRVFDQRNLDEPPIHLLYMQFQPGGTLADVVKLVRATDPAERTGALLLETIDRSLLKTAQVVPERSAVREWLATAPWPMVVAWIGIQLARALENAHGRDVMHRDVKPANVLLSAEGIPKLADFNVSFAGSAGRAGASGSFGGSVGYMAPEHLRAINAMALSEMEEVGPRADLYSLAILLWELWQGRRPFDCQSKPSSWSDAINQQLDARFRELPSPPGGDDSLSMILERVLREALVAETDDRIATGTEFAAKLNLAMHPEVAKLFDPEPNSWRGWLSRQSPWWIAAGVILVPNALAAAYGWYYNFKDTLGKLFKQNEDLESAFYTLANTVNAIAFPLAVILVLYFTREVVRGLHAAVEDKTRVSQEALFAIPQLAHRAAVIGGFLWCVAAVLYPTVLGSMFPEIGIREFGHFFLSHVICGGVAAIYPFFGITVYATIVLYPKMLRNTLNDPGFDARMNRLILRCERYLYVAIAVPLLGATLLLVSSPESRDVMLITIGLAMLGLIAAFKAYQFIVRQWSAMAKLLSAKQDSAVPS